MTTPEPDRIDEASAESFPASDPVSFIEPGRVNDGDRKLPVVEAANRGKAGRPGSRPRKGKATRS